MAETKILSVRIPQATRSVIEAQARREGRSLSNLVQKILADYAKKRG